MASFSFVTLAKPFTSHKQNLHISRIKDQLVVPQSDRVLICLEELPEKSAGGVLLPKSAMKFERCLVGEVVSLGAEVGKVEKGEEGAFL